MLSSLMDIIIIVVVVVINVIINLSGFIEPGADE